MGRREGCFGEEVGIDSVGHVDHVDPVLPRTDDAQPAGAVETVRVRDVAVEGRPDEVDADAHDAGARSRVAARAGVVLATGDPLCHGIASYLASRLCIEAVEVLPPFPATAIRALSPSAPPLRGQGVAGIQSHRQRNSPIVSVDARQKRSGMTVS